MYDMKALYQAASVEEAVALRLEHPEAQIIAANEYNASEGAQLMQESNLALVQGIRDLSLIHISEPTRPY